MSSGAYTLPELTRVATNYGLDVIFLSDSLIANIQYGLPPLRHVVWADYDNRGVLREGAEAYLEAVARENARQANVLYIPGVEITPRFHWTGSWLTGDLTCRNHQRNLIALGTDTAEAIRDIPITAGYIRGVHSAWRWSTRILLALFLLAILAILFGAPALARRSAFPVGELRRSLLTGILAPLAVAMIVLNILAGRNPDFDLYAADQPARFEQRTLDYLARHNIPCFWAHPEEPDLHEFRAAGLRFTVRTDPYPEILRQTAGYTGFAGVNEGRNDLIQPESAWDTLLLQSLTDSRRRPAWCFGEMLYHYEGQAGKKMGNVQTMVWSGRREPAALLEAIRAGRFYARRNSDTQSLKLETWQAGGGLSGERVRAPEARVPIRLAVSARVPGARLAVQVLRNGSPIRQETLVAPFRLEFDDEPPAGEPVYYRALVLGDQPVRLVTNPIFVDR
jgi:hypothetical protein